MTVCRGGSSFVLIGNVGPVVCCVVCGHSGGSGPWAAAGTQRWVRIPAVQPMDVWWMHHAVGVVQFPQRTQSAESDRKVSPR